MKDKDGRDGKTIMEMYNTKSWQKTKNRERKRKGERERNGDRWEEERKKKKVSSGDWFGLWYKAYTFRFLSFFKEQTYQTAQLDSVLLFKPVAPQVPMMNCMHPIEPPWNHPFPPSFSTARHSAELEIGQWANDNTIKRADHREKVLGMDFFYL